MLKFRTTVRYDGRVYRQLNAQKSKGQSIITANYAYLSVPKLQLQQEDNMSVSNFLLERKKKKRLLMFVGVTLNSTN